MKTDWQIKDDVTAELLWHPSIDAAQVGVAVKDGVVTLSGTLRTHIQKWAVEQAVRKVAGVRGIALDLDVNLAPDHERNDSEIAATALQALAWDTRVPADRVQVEVEAGRITLSGDVEWGYQARAAETCVHALKGVRSVANKIRIRPMVDGKHIHDQITAAFARHAVREAGHIALSVDNGVVTLEGTVSSMAEHRAAIGTATAAPGVCGVIDHLKVAA